MKLSKDQIQKLSLSFIGFIVLLYVYFNFFLGPLNASRKITLGKIDDVQSKLAHSKDDLAKAKTLEKQAAAAIKRFEALKSLSPEGAPIAWFPPRMKSFFARQHIDKAIARLESSAAFKEPDLTGWTQYIWTIDVPQSDFSVFGHAVAELENSEPLLSIRHLNIRAASDEPEFQQISLSAVTATVKR